MNIYDLIAEHYSELFLLEPEKRDVIRHLCSCSGKPAMQATLPVILQFGLCGRGLVSVDSRFECIDGWNRKTESCKVSTHPER